MLGFFFKPRKAVNSDQYHKEELQDAQTEAKLLRYQLDMAIAFQLVLQAENSRLREEVEHAARERSAKKKDGV